MQLNATTFRWTTDNDGDWLCIRTKDAIKTVGKIENGKIYDIEIKEHKEKRSLSANAYFWVLVDKLSEKLHIPADEIYRTYIKDIGGNNQIVPLKNEAVKEWVDNWSKRGAGWVCEILDACKTPGYTYVKTYYGSSCYTTSQMSRLIDLAVQDCKAQDIDTLTPEKLSAMLDRWEE